MHQSPLSNVRLAIRLLPCARHLDSTGTSKRSIEPDHINNSHFAMGNWQINNPFLYARNCAATTLQRNYEYGRSNTTLKDCNLTRVERRRGRSGSLDMAPSIVYPRLDMGGSCAACALRCRTCY